MMNNEDIKKFVHKHTLKYFVIGCNKLNYKILARLVKDGKQVVSELTKEYNASRMAFNRRINILEEIGLLERVSHRRDIIPTKLTLSFMAIINGIEKVAIKECKKQIRKK